MEACCPDDDLVDRFVGGLAANDEQVRVRDHLSTCPGCRRLVSELVKETVVSTPADPDDVLGAPLLRGTQVGRFLILELIGSGAMGMVYAAYDPKLDRKIALKLLRPEAQPEELPGLKTRLLREAQAMARLHHPNVVAIHDAGESGELVYIAMDLVEGRSVREWLVQERGWREVLAVYLQAGRGLAAAHRAGLVHRDFKPENVLVADDGRVLVSDFGLAELEDAETPQGALLISGTPAYMAPEQHRGGPVDARADIFSFAVAVWSGLHGEHPFPTDSLEVLRDATLAGRLRVPGRRGGVPARLRRALLPALRPDPDERPRTIDPLLEALAADPARRLRRVGLAAAALVALGLVGGAIRAAVVAREQTVRARAQTEVARRLGEEVKEMELGLRAERLLPLHDLGPAERRVRNRLDGMRGQLGGTPADAAIHDALGRGLAALGDLPAAREELETALAQGAGDADLHFTLGHVLIRLHDQALDDARRMGGPSWLAARRAALDAEMLPAARLHLSQSRGARIASPGLLEALLAYQAGELDAALAGARAAAAEAPLFWEAQILAGATLEAQATRAQDRHDDAAADRLLVEAIDALEAAARVGRSDIAVYDALAALWIRRLEVALYKAGHVQRLALVAGALLATDRAIGTAPSDARGYRRRALALMHSSQDRLSAALPFHREHLLACVAAAQAAIARDPRDGLSYDTLGNCTGALIEFGGFTADRRPILRRAAEAFADALRVAPGFPWAANDLGTNLVRTAEVEWWAGRDPSKPASAVMSACDLAQRLDPGYAFPSMTEINAYVLLAAALTARGVWDADLEARAYATAEIAVPLNDAAHIVNDGNLLPMAALKLEHALEAGDATAALAELRGRIAAYERIMRPEWETGELGLMLVEARVAAALGTGDRDAARPLVARCLAIDPLRISCRLLEARVDPPSPARARELVRDFPQSGRSWAVLAAALARRPGGTALALAAAATAAALAPPLVEAHAVTGRLELAAGHPGRALAALERAVALNPLWARRLEAERRAAIGALSP